MSVIVNPRGTSGSGKTELVRRILALYERDGGRERLYRERRARPICYRLRHPLGGRPLVVLGHYEVTSGGCDTIGGLNEVFRLAGEHASNGHDVLFEGLMVSGEHQRSARLARTHGLHVLRLSTPLEQCVRNLIARRRARRAVRPLISKITAAHHESIEDACGRLEHCASLEVVDFDRALARALELLGWAARDGGAGARPAALAAYPGLLGRPKSSST